MWKSVCKRCICQKKNLISKPNSLAIMHSREYAFLKSLKNNFSTIFLKYQKEYELQPHSWFSHFIIYETYTLSVCGDLWFNSMEEKKGQITSLSLVLTVLSICSHIFSEFNNKEWPSWNILLKILYLLIIFHIGLFWISIGKKEKGFEKPCICKAT